MRVYLAGVGGVKKPEQKPEQKQVKRGRPPTRHHPKGAQRTAEGYKLKTITMLKSDIDFMKDSSRKRGESIKTVYAEAIALYKKKYGK